MVLQMTYLQYDQHNSSKNIRYMRNAFLNSYNMLTKQVNMCYKVNTNSVINKTIFTKGEVIWLVKCC